jgi:hypothetical protein
LLPQITINDLAVSSVALYNSDYVILKPRESIECGISGTIGGMNGNKDGEVIFSIDVFRFNGEPVRIDYPSRGEFGDDNATTQNGYWKMVDDLAKEGKVAVEGDGYIVLTEMDTRDYEGISSNTGSEYGDIIVATGKVSYIEELSTSFHLKIINEAKSTKLPVIKDNGYYKMRVTQTDLYVDRLSVAVEMVFLSYAEAMEYTPWSESKLDSNWQILVRGIDNTRIASASTWSVVNDKPKEMPDGTWVWEYQYNASSLTRHLEGIMIIPCWGSREKGESIARPEEGITIMFDTITP